MTLALFYLRKPSKCVGTQSKNLIHLKHFLFKKLFFLIALPKWSVTLLRKNIFSNKTIPNRFLAKPVGHIVYRTDAPWFSAAKISVKSKFIFIVTSKLANISRIFFFSFKEDINHVTRQNRPLCLQVISYFFLIFKKKSYGF